MKNIINFKLLLSILFLPIVLASCGGDDSSSNDQSQNDSVFESPQAPNVETKSFNIELTGLAVQRVSNGDEVAVDFSGVRSTGTYYLQ